ncbi:MAG: tetratricopeptide repeat protein [Oscillatoriales cyanobacterium RM1_1_9]|nr:tetratricopeptide repeat protein [Oscillatoriales cyanobacterium SM2_3_0]NJO44493.1 tetratricopeptide repeat protein [Oscillatoriales cyanobacterium RM2_1_1]NJO70995.1 tetratricopeptide repeat protein [Oscillatoriales cyanobacterium RM1_1_9]
MADDSYIQILLQDLKSSDKDIRRRATQELWRLWFEQKGEAGLEKIRKSEVWLQMGEISEAEAILNQLIQDLPDFAEAWNRRAVLYYLSHQYEKALEDCKRAIALNPIHFGALHGTGLCHAALGNYSAAIQAFQQALEVQPYSLENQRLILECTAKL